MAWLLATIVLIGSVTAIAARLIVARQPGLAASSQIMLAAASFPALSGAVVAVLIAVQIAQKTPAMHDGSFGMVIFAIVLFWFYGLMASVFVALPTAWFCVRRFRRG